MQNRPLVDEELRVLLRFAEQVLILPDPLEKTPDTLSDGNLWTPAKLAFSLTHVRDINVLVAMPPVSVAYRNPPIDQSFEHRSEFSPDT